MTTPRIYRRGDYWYWRYRDARFGPFPTKDAAATSRRKYMAAAEVSQ